MRVLFVMEMKKETYLQIRIQTDLLDEARTFAEKRDTAISQIVREALREKLARENGVGVPNLIENESVSEIESEPFHQKSEAPTASYGRSGA